MFSSFSGSIFRIDSLKGIDFPSGSAEIAVMAELTANMYLNIESQTSILSILKFSITGRSD